MIVVASSGLNLPSSIIEACQIAETPQTIVVDGALHEVREIDSLETMKRLMRTAKTPPHLLGSSAAEYVALFQQLHKRTGEVLVVTGTRKFLGSYDAAVAAVRTLGGTRKALDARVLDTKLVEIGAGLIAAYCGAMARAGHGLNAVQAAGQALTDASTLLCAPSDLEFLNRLMRTDLVHTPAPRDGNSGFPIIGLKDGEFRQFGNRAKSPHAVQEFVEILEERYRPGTALWVTVTFSEDIAPAQDLLTRLKRVFDVRYSLLTRMGYATYLFLGPNALGVSVHPVGAMKIMVKLPESR